MQQAVSPQAGMAVRGLFAILMALSACQPQAIKPPVTLPSTPSMDAAGASLYRINSSATSLHVLVYRGGAMARLGHNHVLSSHQVSGAVRLDADLPRSQVELSFPVNTLVVDDPQDRASEGEDFAVAVPDDARDGTRHNLLRPEILDGNQFPMIALHSVSIAGSRDQPTLLMRITIKNVAHDVPISAQVQETAQQLIASGEFDIRQTDFGMTPFSIAMGALRVQDVLHIRFKLVADRLPST